MLNFDFYNPTRILFGKGRIADLDKVVPPTARVLILYGGGSVKSNGVLDEVRAALGARNVQEFAGIECGAHLVALGQRPDLAHDGGEQRR